MPPKVMMLLAGNKRGEFPANFLQWYGSNKARLGERFLGLFGGVVSPDNMNRMRTFALSDDVPNEINACLDRTEAQIQEYRRLLRLNTSPPKGNRGVWPGLRGLSPGHTPPSGSPWAWRYLVRERRERIENAPEKTDNATAVLDDLRQEAGMRRRLIAQAQVQVPDLLIESELEGRFVAALEAHQKRPLRPWTKLLRSGKWCYELQAEGGKLWLLEPQVDLGPGEGAPVPCRPDFVLWPQGEQPGALPVAVFTDGPPEKASQERQLFVGWTKELVRAVVELALPGAEPEGKQTAPIHLIFRPPRAWGKDIFDHGLCDCLALDEASQMNLPEAAMAALPLKRGGQLIVVGDHRQMPPIVKHDWDRELRRTFQQYRVYDSLFDTLRSLKPPVVQFTESSRVHAAIADFLRQEVYRHGGIDYHSGRRTCCPRGPGRTTSLRPSCGLSTRWSSWFTARPAARSGTSMSNR